MMNRKITKIAGLLLSLILLTGCFAGCKEENEKEELVIGITYFAPMNYMENNELTGFETEFAKAVCNKLGMTAKFQEIKWESKENELNGNAIDCIWNGIHAGHEEEQEGETPRLGIDLLPGTRRGHEEPQPEEPHRREHGVGVRPHRVRRYEHDKDEAAEDDVKAQQPRARHEPDYEACRRRRA